MAALPTSRLLKAIQKKLVEDAIVVKEPIIPSTRLERLGTIFSRATGLIKSEALKKADIPIWYHVYQAFPPKYEPVYDRPPVSNVKVHNILYPEDKLRAKFYRDVYKQSSVSLIAKGETLSQQFILRYYMYKATCDAGKSEDEIMEEFFQQEKSNLN